MSTLNSRLQLSILNRTKGKNLAEKGFTLIELLITVVILGTLSSIALPTFLNQQDKAKASGVTSLIRNAASSCQTLQVTEETGTYKPLEHVTGTCNAAGTASNFTVVDTAGSGSPGEGWSDPASAIISADGEITVDKGSKTAI